MRRRKVLAVLAGGMLGATRLAADTPPEIAISARKFVFNPAEVRARVGQPVILVLTSQDRIHGFKLPDFGVRAEIVPGQETRVTLLPQKIGSFPFLCDTFCGDGHEDMEGTLIVFA